MGSCRLRTDAALISFLRAYPCKFKILVVSLPQNEAKKTQINLVFHSICTIFAAEKEMIMAKPIEPTPVSKGDDAGVKCYNNSGKAASARRLTTARTRENL